MEKSIEESVFVLNIANIDAIIFGYTSGSLLFGVGWDQKIIKRIKKKTKVVVTNTSTSSVIEALKVLVLKRIGIII